MSNTLLQKNIMRRVYYAYVQRLAVHPFTIQVALLAAIVWWLTELVFVARVWQSFTATPVGELGSFSIKVISGADALTLGVTLAACVLVGSLLYKMPRLHPSPYTTMQSA